MLSHTHTHTHAHARTRTHTHTHSHSRTRSLAHTGRPRLQSQRVPSLHGQADRGGLQRVQSARAYTYTTTHTHTPGRYKVGVLSVCIVLYLTSFMRARTDTRPPTHPHTPGRYKVGVLSVCIVLYLTSFVGIILMYIFFTDDCEGLANSFISITLVCVGVGVGVCVSVGGETPQTIAPQTTARACARTHAQTHTHSALTMSPKMVCTCKNSVSR